jgi:predicted dehydrogenase
MVVETVKSDVPDLISVTASLKGEKYIQEGASLFISFRRGPPFPGEPHLTWTIHGEKGEIKFTAEGGTTPRTIASKPVNITLHDFFTKQVQVIEWSWESWCLELPTAARGVARLYEAYARGDDTAYFNIQHALKRHEQLESILTSKH